MRLYLYWIANAVVHCTIQLGTFLFILLFMYGIDVPMCVRNPPGLLMLLLAEWAFAQTGAAHLFSTIFSGKGGMTSRLATMCAAATIVLLVVVSFIANDEVFGRTGTNGRDPLTPHWLLLLAVPPFARRPLFSRTPTIHFNEIFSQKHCAEKKHELCPPK